MSPHEEAEACIQQFMARYSSRTLPVQEATESNPNVRYYLLLRAATLCGSVHAVAEDSVLTFTLGGERKLAFKWSEPVHAHIILRSMLANLAFALDELVFGPSPTPNVGPQPAFGSPAMARWVQSIAAQTRPLEFDAYGFSARIIWAQENAKHKLLIETSNTNGRPYFLAITRLET